jgi:NADP-dependent 3-hydroxy acid dehydrogenase YdfG
MSEKKVVVITGGSSGIGLALAKELSEYTVVILSRNETELKKAAKEASAEYELSDVTRISDIQRATKNILDRHGRIDILVNNAGIWIEGPLEKNNPEKISEVIDVNTKGTILMTNAVIENMLKQKSGLVVNIISRAGITAKAERSVYNASKWAITGFTQCLQDEFQSKGVRVTGIYPGYVDTKLFEKAGNPRDLAGALSVNDVVRSVAFVIRENSDVEIQHLVIKHNG